MEDLQSRLSAVPIHPVGAELFQHQLPQRVVQVGGVEGAARRLLAGVARILEGPLAEHALAVLHAQLASVKADRGDETHVADERVEKLADPNPEISVAQTLAAKRRERIAPNQELIGLGASNIAAAIGGGYPVTGGFARPVVNFDAGAATPAAGAFTAIGIAGATLLLTPFLAILPKATLAATIVLAVLTLVDFSILKRAWSYSKADFAAVAHGAGYFDQAHFINAFRRVAGCTPAAFFPRATANE